MSVDAGVAMKINDPNPRPRVHSDAGVSSVTNVVKRKVTINAQPGWSYFTVDGNATVYQTVETLELTPGPHKIHFSGNDFVKADRTITITVPDADGFTHSEKLDPPDRQ